MRCTDCERPLLALFYSMVCEFCTDAPHGRFHVGYVLWDEDEPAGGQLTYVWRTRHDAVRWRTIRADESLPIYCVLSEHPFTWRPASRAAVGLTVAAELCEIYPNHRFPPAPNRAFVAPPAVDPRTERVIIAPAGECSADLTHESSHSA